MKLKNKLLPLFTTVALASVVTPAVSSCGFLKRIITGDTCDITTPYTPTEGKAEKVTKEQKVTQQDVYSLYMSKIMENPKILQQDIWQYESKILPLRIYDIEHTSMDESGKPLPHQTEKCNTVTNVEAKIVATSIEINKHEAIIATKKIEFYTVDMVLGYDFAFTATSLSNEPKIQFVNKIHFETEYHNIPIYIYNAGSAWGVSVDVLTDDSQELLKFAPGWYMYYDITNEYETEVTIKGNVQNYSNKVSYNDTLTRRSQIWALQEGDEPIFATLNGNYMKFVSYYLSDVYCPDQMVKFAPTEDVYDDGEYEIPDPATEKTYDIKWSHSGVSSLYKMFQLSDVCIEKIRSKGYDRVNVEFLDSTDGKWKPTYTFKGDGVDIQITENTTLYWDQKENALYYAGFNMHCANGFEPNKDYQVNIAPGENIYRAVLSNSKTGEFEVSEGTMIEKSLGFKINTIQQQ